MGIPSRSSFSHTTPHHTTPHHKNPPDCFLSEPLDNARKLDPVGRLRVSAALRRDTLPSFLISALAAAAFCQTLPGREKRRIDQRSAESPRLPDHTLPFYATNQA
jgi:hypothetical protein